jgi:Kef-type K+ transport system membrane component KefB
MKVLNLIAVIFIAFVIGTEYYTEYINEDNYTPDPFAIIILVILLILNVCVLIKKED